MSLINAPSRGSWTFLSNHSHVIICLAGDPSMRMREIAVRVGITERAVQRIISELQDAGAIVRSREGRQNRYQVNLDVPLRHPLEAHRSLGSIIAAIGPKSSEQVER